MIGVPTEERLMYSHFVDGILSDEFHSLTTNQVKEIVMRNHFSFVPLIPLTEREEQLLMTLATEDLHHILNYQNLKSLCGKVFYDGETFYINGGERKARYTANSPRLLSTDQKIKLLLDPKIWWKKRIGFSDGGSDCLTRYGNRNLLHPDGYFDSEEGFKELLEKLRQKNWCVQTSNFRYGLWYG